MRQDGSVARGGHSAAALPAMVSFLSIVHNAVVNIHAQVYVETKVLFHFGYISKSKI